MKLEKKDIEHIANLARLELSEAELKKYGGQLSDVLSYVDQLQEVNTDDVEPTAQVTGLENVWQEDKIEIWDDAERKNTLKQAPKIEKNQIKVKRVLK
ncbi:MAG: Asp-tRNA(Asn)/Glu-tRNA(Gln) amidotransferase subunit GatC [Patescibacteria group bacterium]|nr:Asp-tRNA(Asn)/Glu-tRNA(Gln) amidotransferase subunit GatC [Patescibacteria group bacterium]